jgi:16S rRNA (cytosine967-C5)-methyltransferase
MSIAANQLRIARELWARLQPLDRAVPTRLQTLLADRRFGSRDRRLYRELLFTALRLARPLARLAPGDEPGWAALVANHCAATRDTEPFRAAHGATTPAPAPSPLDLVPPWFSAEHEPALPATPAETAAALLARAPVWVRLQTDSPDDALAEWAARGWVANSSPHPALADARRLPPETKVTDCAAYQAGHYEVQDLGSQAILASLGLPDHSPGPRWLDACAGAGGKTLQLARLLGPSARIDATDIRPAPLAELRARAARAGLAARIRTLPGRPDPAARYDGVLVDAPCSGSGTWRRAPHLMACTSAEDLAAAARTQLELLRRAAPLVRPGGLLVYATCSIARTENTGVAAAFLAAEAGSFRVEPPVHALGFCPLAPGAPGLALAPGPQDNDGFYVASFRRVG